MEIGNFKSERISRTASFIVRASIEQAFLLFDAFEERKWELGWDPQLIYPDKEIIEEGTTFKIINKPGEGFEPEYLWIVIQFDSKIHLIQYLVSTPNRFWTITVKCESINKSQTKASITYAYTGLNDLGNELNKKSLEQMYRNNLKDWEQAINRYLEIIL